MFRQLGVNSGLEVDKKQDVTKPDQIQWPQLGFGCLGLTSKTTNIIDHAIKNGICLFDTANCYGNGESEVALGKAIQKHNRKNLIITTKVGVEFTANGIQLNGKPDYILKQCEASLKRLNLDYLDLYYLHRADPEVKIESSMLAFKKLVEQGKIKQVGLSEVTADQIRRAHKVHPVSAVQIEFSPWSREDETNGVIATCKELGIKIIGYSPIGRAFFSELKTNDFESLPKEDFRKMLPRYNNEVLKSNMEKRRILDRFVGEKNQGLLPYTLAWIIAQGIIPIPGTTKVKHLDEILGCNKIKLSQKEVDEFRKTVDSLHFEGLRYPNEEISAIYPEKEKQTLDKNVNLTEFSLLTNNRTLKGDKKSEVDNNQGSMKNSFV